MANPFNKSFKANKVFTDRTDCKEIIQKAIIEPQTFEEYRVKVFYGVGGQGKTYLKDKYLMRDFLKNHKGSQSLHVFGGLDFENNANTRVPVEGCLAIAKFLIEKAGIPVPAFMVGFSRHYQLTSSKKDIAAEYPYLFQIPQTVRFNKHKNFQVLYEAINSIKSTFVQGTPFIGPWLNDLSKKGTNKFIERISKSEAKEVLWDIDNLDSLELVERLPKLIGYDLYCEFKENSAENKIPNKRIAIVFDGYETLWEYEKGGSLNKDKWVRNLVTYCPGVLFLFFGRDKLRWGEVEKNKELNDSIEQKRLLGLDQSDANHFLRSVPIENPEIIKVIIQNSQGNDRSNKRCLPLYLATEVETYENIINSGKTPSSEDFQYSDESELGIVHRLMKHLPHHLKVGIKPLSLAKYIDNDILSIVESEGFPIGTISLNMLADMSVFDENGGRLFMQPLFKKIIEKLYKDEFLKKFEKIHNKLFDYYDQILQKRKFETIDAEIEDLIRNASHHLKQINDVKFVKWVQEINDYFNGDSFNSVFGDLLNDVLEIIHNSDDTQVSKEEQAHLYYQLSIKQQNSGYFTEAKISATEAVKLYKEIPNIQNAGEIASSVDLSDPVYQRVQESMLTNKIMREVHELSLELIAILSGRYTPEDKQPLERYAEIQGRINDILESNPDINSMLEAQTKSMLSNLNFVTNPNNPLQQNVSGGLFNPNEEFLEYNRKNSCVFERYIKALEHQASVFLRLNEISKCKDIYDELEEYRKIIGIQLDETKLASFLVACGRHSEAEPILFKEYQKYKSSDRITWSAHYAQQLASLFSRQKRYEEAITFGTEAVELSSEIRDGGKTNLVYKHTFARILLSENPLSDEALSLLQEVEKGYSTFYHSNPYFWGLLHGDFFTYWIGLDKLKARGYYKKAVKLIEKAKGIDSNESIGLTIELLSMVPEDELSIYENELNKVVELFTKDIEKIVIKFGIYHRHLFNGLNLVSLYYNKLNDTQEANKLANLRNEYKRLSDKKTKIRTHFLPKLAVDDSQNTIDEIKKITSIPSTNLIVNQYDLPFYSQSMLYELTFTDNELAQDKYLIKRKDELVLIDWDINTIHSFNASNLDLNESNVLLYLKFFTDILKSNSGTFYILHPDNIPYRLDQNIEDDIKDLIEDIVESPKIINVTNDTFEISAYVLYVSEIFYCEFSIPFSGLNKGYIEIEKNEVILLTRNNEGTLCHSKYEDCEAKKDIVNSIELPCRIEMIV